ncbi:DUF4434 domain-containing protein [Stenotrophomonas maltophilia]|uniref:DUF4434 domain-containing protein n=1 Tax=Stenotrophomonas maltophilia TaxID=40324 RepID=UPI003BF7D72C
MNRIGLIAVLACTAPVHAASPLLSGSFVHVGYSGSDEQLPAAQLPLFLDELQDLGNDTIILGQVRATRAGVGCASGVQDFEWIAGFPGKLGTVLDAAAARGMKVVVGTTYSSGQCATFWQGQNATAVAQDAAQSLAQLGQQYGSHPAFAGWYITDEPAQVPADRAPFYRAVVTALKGSTPSRPVMVAPYLASSSVDPASVGRAAAQFRTATGVDVQIWQDGIGAASHARLFQWDRPGHSTEAYFEALSAALGASGLWADIELFNHGSPLFLETGNGLSGAYRSASVQRINQQLWSARSAGKRVAWLNQYHMSEVVGPGQGYAESSRMMNTYRGLYGLGASYLVDPVQTTYSYSVAPDANYPDSSGHELFDRRVGDPRNPMDAGWVGVHGNASITIDLGQRRRVDWIGLHTMTRPAWGIVTPTAVEVMCAEPGAAAVKIGVLSAPFPQAGLSGSTEEEYVLGNAAPLAAQCRTLELRLANGSWTFLSEIEMAAEQ